MRDGSLSSRSGKGWVDQAARSPLAARLVAAAAVVAVIAFFGFAEWVLAAPLPLGWYLVGGLLVAAGAGWAFVAGARRFALLGVATGILVLLVLFAVPWTSRKDFLRHFARIEPGMTADQVREVMAHYRPVSERRSALVYEPAGDGAGSPRVVDVYRHGRDRRFAADVALVVWDGDRVASTRFLPD